MDSTDIKDASTPESVAALIERLIGPNDQPAPPYARVARQALARARERRWATPGDTGECDAD